MRPGGPTTSRGTHPTSSRTCSPKASAAAVPSDDLDLLRSLYLDAEPVHEAARRLSVSPRTVLSRRLAATRRLRVVAA